MCDGRRGAERRGSVRRAGKGQGGQAAMSRSVRVALMDSSIIAISGLCGLLFDLLVSILLSFNPSSYLSFSIYFHHCFEDVLRVPQIRKRSFSRGAIPD